MSTLACERRWRSVWPAAGFLAAVVSILLATPATVQAQLAKVETEKMRLVYVDGTESYLVPHAARTFLNSLEFQRRLFDFEPHEKITVLLVDFSDSGNAGASVVARNVVTVQIAPLSFEFETIAANERMNTIMNHELVHIATMDQAAKKDRVFRRLFGGKVNPVSAHPESMFYFFLTTPRVAAPRWYHEGSPCSSTRGWPEGSAARRAGTTRWSSARWSGTMRRSTIRWGWCRKGPRSTSSSRSTRTSTARGS